MQMQNQASEGGEREPTATPIPAQSEIVRAIAARTPARLMVGRAGPAYRTATQLDLKADHAFAVDAVREPLDLAIHLGAETIKQWQLFEVVTEAGDKEEYLARPDLGRRLSAASQAEITARCPRQADLQVLIGDGLSVAALSNAPAVLSLLAEGARERGWTFGQPFVARHCRVGVLNDVGNLLEPVVAVLLIGERPGLATADSLSAYLAYRPRPGHTDAQRNLISNIHSRGVAPTEAAARILELAAAMRRLEISGVTVKEESRGLLGS